MISHFCDDIETPTGWTFNSIMEFIQVVTFSSYISLFLSTIAKKQRIINITITILPTRMQIYLSFRICSNIILRHLRNIYTFYYNF